MLLFLCALSSSAGILFVCRSFSLQCWKSEACRRLNLWRCLKSYRRHRCFSIRLKQTNTSAHCCGPRDAPCPLPPLLCAPGVMTPPETGWRQRGSWEWEDEVTHRRLCRIEGRLSPSLSLRCNSILRKTQLCTLSGWTNDMHMHMHGLFFDTGFDPFLLSLC